MKRKDDIMMIYISKSDLFGVFTLVKVLHWTRLLQICTFIFSPCACSTIKSIIPNTCVLKRSLLTSMISFQTSNTTASRTLQRRRNHLFWRQSRDQREKWSSNLYIVFSSIPFIDWTKGFEKVRSSSSSLWKQTSLYVKHLLVYS